MRLFLTEEQTLAHKPVQSCADRCLNGRAPVAMFCVRRPRERQAAMHPIILPAGSPLWAELLVTAIVLAGVWVSLRAFFRNRE